MQCGYEAVDFFGKSGKVGKLESVVVITSEIKAGLRVGGNAEIHKRFRTKLFFFHTSVDFLQVCMCCVQFYCLFNLS